MTLTSPATGQGDASLDFRVAANSDPAARATAITIQNQQVQVSQAGRPCAFQVSSTLETVEPAGGERTVQVAASSAQCRWTAASDAPWIAIASAHEVSGSGTVVLRVEPLAGPARTGSVTIAGQVLRIEQGGRSNSCSYVVDPPAFTSPAAGGVSVLNVRTAAQCAWTAASAASWAVVTAGQSGSGPGEVVVTVAANAGPSRSTSLNIAGLTITVSQSPGCSIAVVPASVSVGAEASPVSVQVVTGDACAWSSSTNTPWIAFAEGASGGTGSGSARFSVAPNAGPARQGAVSIGGVTVPVAQANGCRYSIAPAAQDVGGSGGNGTVSVSTAAECPWTAASGADWIAVGRNSGTGPLQLPFTVAANPGPARTGTITAAGHAFTVRQASPCTWSFSPPYHWFDASGGNGAILVLVTGPCTWTAASDAAWIRVTSGATGAGSGLVQIAVSANTGTARTGVLTIGGERYEVQQAGR